jgi:hypothetical protein
MIPLVSKGVDRQNSYVKILDSGGTELSTIDSVVSLMPPAKTSEVKGNIVFAGYGYENKKESYSDFDGIDIKGKIVMIMTRTPATVKSGDGKSPFSEQLESMKFMSLMSRGPAGVLFVYDPLNDFSDAYESGLADIVGKTSVSEKGKQEFTLPLQVLFITRHTANIILKPSGFNLRSIQQKMMSDGKPASCEIPGITAVLKTSIIEKDINVPNVIGIIEGSDPVLKNECIIYSAHFDHTGMGANGKVLNGADDNASGSMALLEIAEAFMNLKKRPLRTIIFAWVNAEEKGLLGSKYYSEHPVISMEKSVVNINLDMVGRSRTAADTGNFFGMKLTVTEPGELDLYTAHESKELIDIVKTSASEAGLKINDKGQKMDFGTSDHASFTAKGVPALFFNSGVHKDLHKTGDDVELIDFDKMERSAKLSFLIGYRVAVKSERIKIDKAQ